jgi:hypothetical protein
LAAGFAERIDALHGKTGHVLHFSPSQAAKLGSIFVRPENGRAQELASPLAAQFHTAFQSREGRVLKRGRHSRQGRAGTERMMARILP